MLQSPRYVALSLILAADPSKIALSDGIYDAVTYTVGDYAILIIQLKDSANDDLCAFTAAGKKFLFTFLLIS